MTTVVRALHLTDEGAQAADVRRWYSQLYDDRFGVMETGMAVTEKSGTPDMSVDVAAGFAFVDGTQSASQGAYVIENDGVQNVTISAADPTNARKDLICAYVTDTDEGAGTAEAVIGATTGTPAGSPAEPTAPDNSIVLAMVDVAAAASSILDANITDRRFTTTDQTRVPSIGGSRIVAYDSSNDATTLIIASATTVAGLSVSFTAYDGYVYELFYNTGLWTDGSGSEQTAKFTTTGLDTDQEIAWMTFGGGAGDSEQHTAAILLEDSDVTAGTTYTVGIEGQCVGTAGDTVTKAAPEGKLWVRESPKGY